MIQGSGACARGGALLPGPIAAAIFFASSETPVRVPARPYVLASTCSRLPAARAVAGCMNARKMPLALQSARFIVVAVRGPTGARAVARRIPSQAP